MKRRRIGRGGHSHPTGTIAASTSLDSVACTFNVDTNTTISTLELPPTNTTVLVPSQGFDSRRLSPETLNEKAK